MFQRAVRQQIAGELLDGELVELLILVERLDDPIAIGPHFAVVVEVHAMRIGISGRIEPIARRDVRHIAAKRAAYRPAFRKPPAKCRPQTFSPTPALAASPRGPGSAAARVCAVGFRRWRSPGLFETA